MKLIALKDFRNVQILGIAKNHKDTNRNGQIDKGERFEIGKADDFKALNNHEKQLVAQLVYAGCVGDAKDEKIVAAVEAEIEVDKRREAALKDRTTAADNSALVAQILAALKKEEAPKDPALKK